MDNLEKCIQGRSLRILYIWPHPYQPKPHKLHKHKTTNPTSLTDPDWGSRRWWSCLVCLHSAAISWSGPGPRWCEDKQITRAVSIRIHAEKSRQTALIRHDTAWSYAVRKEADGGAEWAGWGNSGARWKDGCDCNWLIKVRGGQDAGDSWQRAAEVVQHFAWEGNTSRSHHSSTSSTAWQAKLFLKKITIT